MKRIVLSVLGLLMASTAFAQTPDEALERALAPAPRGCREQPVTTSPSAAAPLAGTAYVFSLVRCILFSPLYSL